MYHYDKGKTTFELYEEERLARLAEESARNAKLTEVATVLRALEASKRADNDAIEDMIEEGGPVRDDNQGEKND